MTGQRVPAQRRSGDLARTLVRRRVARSRYAVADGSPDLLDLLGEGLPVCGAVSYGMVCCLPEHSTPGHYFVTVRDAA